jgi:hypothetical protein
MLPLTIDESFDGDRNDITGGPSLSSLPQEDSRLQPLTLVKETTGDASVEPLQVFLAGDRDDEAGDAALPVQV